MVSSAATGPVQARPVSRTAAIATTSTMVSGIRDGRKRNMISSSPAPDVVAIWATERG